MQCVIKLSTIRNTPFSKMEHYRASTVLQRGRGFCVAKAVVLCAAGRACGIPSRLGFANIRNQKASPDLLEMLRTDVFIFHGFVEFLLNGSWIKATPTFHKEIYERHNIEPVTFDGRQHAILPSHDRDGNPYVEYLVYHGSRADVPLEDMLAAWHAAYGDRGVNLWRQGGRKWEEMP